MKEKQGICYSKGLRSMFCSK